MPSTATVAPGRAPLFRSALKVVIPAHMSGAASTAGIPSGISARAVAGTVTQSAYPPSYVIPGTWAAIWQVTKSPRRHESQYPQCPPCQPTPTRWPAFHPATPVPSASIVPAISCPGTRGYRMPGHDPCFVKESLWQIPQASTLTRTNPVPGSGFSRSTSSKRPFG